MDRGGQNTVGPGSCTQRYPAYSCPHFILLSTLYPPASSQNVFRNQNYPCELQRGGGGALYKSHHECPIYILLARRCWWQHCDRGDRNSARLCSRRRLHTRPPATAVRRFPILKSGLSTRVCIAQVPCPSSLCSTWPPSSASSTIYSSGVGGGRQEELVWVLYTMDI